MTIQFVSRKTFIFHCLRVGWKHFTKYLTYFKKRGFVEEVNLLKISKDTFKLVKYVFCNAVRYKNLAKSALILTFCPNYPNDDS